MSAEDLKDKDFEKAFAFLKQKGLAKNQKELAGLVNKSSTTISEMRQANLFPRDWIKTLFQNLERDAEERGENISMIHAQLNEVAEEFEGVLKYDPSTAKPPKPQINDYKFFNDTAQYEKMCGSSWAFHSHLFPNTMALNKGFLAKKGYKDEELFLYKDEKGKNSPYISGQDILVLVKTKTFTHPSFYLVKDAEKLRVCYIQKIQEGRENYPGRDQDINHYIIEEVTGGYSNTVKGEQLCEYILGRVVFKFTDEIGDPNLAYKA